MHEQVNPDMIREFIIEQVGGKRVDIPLDADLFEKLRLEGDDCSDFIEAFAKRFEIDMTGYLWYFHHGEERGNLGSLFVRPPNNRVDPIPITIDLLVKSAEARRWLVDYPPHKLPARRRDIIINQLLFVVLVGGGFLFWLYAHLFR